MSMTLLQAAQEVARLIGGASVTSQTTVAKQSVKDALRDFDARNDKGWEFKLRTLNDVTVSSGDGIYDLVIDAGGTNPKQIHSARLKNNPRILYFIRQREYDRLVWNQESNSLPTHYTEMRSANSNLAIKLLPTPNTGELLQVRVFEHIVIPSADGDVLDVPDRYLPAILALARYYFLIDRNAEDARVGVYLQKAEQLISLAMKDDIGAPDEDIRFVPSNEWSSGFNTYDPLLNDIL